MRIEITRDAFESALSEIEQLRAEKAESKPSLPDELYRLVTEGMQGGKKERLSYGQMAAYFNKKGWWDGSGSALSQAYRRERNRRKDL